MFAKIWSLLGDNHNWSAWQITSKWQIYVNNKIIPEQKHSNVQYSNMATRGYVKTKNHAILNFVK